MKYNLSATNDMEVDNPFTVAGENVPDPENFDGIENVIPIKARPHDRLPTKGVFKLPPKLSPYHTKRAESARQRGASVLPPAHIATAREAIGGLIGQWNENYADSASHNIMGLTYALWYAEMGWTVVDAYGFYDTGESAGKMQQDGKVPLGAGWQNRASTSQDAIIAAWSGDGAYPPNSKGKVFEFKKPAFPRNVSFVIPQGYWVLDVDDKAALARLEEELGPLPETVRSVSGSGGEHIVFKTDLDIRNTASIVSKKIDVRGFGGQIIVEPSLHKTGGFYRWADGCAPWECEVVSAPEAWEQAAFTATKSRQDETKRKSSTKTTDKGRQNSKPPTSRVSGGSDVTGFENILSTIGDHEGGRGFDTPIYRAACSWFASHESDVDSSELFDTIRTGIDEAERSPERDRTKYDTDEYLKGRIEQAREFIAGQDAEDEAADDFESRAEEFDTSSSEEDIREYFKDMHKAGVDLAVRGNVNAVIAKSTNIGKVQLKKFWTDLDKNQKKEKQTESGPSIDLGETGYRAQCNTAADIMADQSGAPSMFHSNGRIAEIREDEQGVDKIEEVKKDRFKARMEDRIDFYGGDTSVEAPNGVVNNVFHRDKTVYPPLHNIIRAPAFDPDMRLITEPGYHPSGVVYRPIAGVDVPRVSACPTDEEVKAAVAGLVDVLGDFMLDAMSREELESAVKNGEPVPSFCHALSAGLTSLCRAFIAGPTPGHLGRKMKPRTGATKLLSSVSYMATLSYAMPQSLPDSKAEVKQTVVASLDSGQQYTFFDNLSDDGKVDFGELASAMTAWPRYTGRRLGVTGMVEAAVNTTWLFTGNKTVLSPELTARVLLIVLDPQMENPEDRTGFKYDHDAHVAANAGKYLHCFLTIVQNWIAKGCEEWGGQPLGGFERHSAIIGGILESAGIMGFLENRDVLRNTVNTAAPEDELMDALIELHHGTPDNKDGTLFRVWGADAPPQFEGTGADREKHPLAKYRVVSIKGALEAESVALKGTGYAHTEDGGVIYPDKAKSALRQFIGSMVGSVRGWGPDREEETRKQGRYILEKAHTDRNSILYRLKRKEF